MRVLITGGSSRQVKPERGGMQKIDVPAYVADALRQGGHTVDWRPVRAGESLDGYDVVWLCWANWLSLNSAPGTIGSLWTWATRVPLVVFMDDWSFGIGFSHARTIGKEPRKYLLKSLRTNDGSMKRLFGGNEDLDANPALIERLGQAASEIADWRRDLSPWNHSRKLSITCPMYPWGRREIVRDRLPDVPWTWIDPSGYVSDETTLIEPTTRYRQWTMASLSDQSDWIDEQNFSWPVEVYGTTKIGAQRLKSEAEVLRRYAYSWGVLSAPYPHAGSGWFRSRYLYSAWQRCVLYCDQRDADGIDPGYGIEPGSVEHLGDVELTRLAERQAAYVLPRHWSSDHFRHAVCLITERTSRGKMDALRGESVFHGERGAA